VPHLPFGLSPRLMALRSRAAQAYARGLTPETRGSLRRGALWSGGVVGAITLGLALFLMLFDWNLLRGPIGAFASARLGREVVLTGDLEAHPWSLRPSATINGLSIGDPDWAGEGKTLEIERLTIQMELPPLFRGRTILSRLELTRPVARPSPSTCRPSAASSSREASLTWSMPGAACASPARSRPARCAAATPASLSPGTAT